MPIDIALSTTTYTYNTERRTEKMAMDIRFTISTRHLGRWHSPARAALHERTLTRKIASVNKNIHARRYREEAASSAKPRKQFFEVLLPESGARVSAPFAAVKAQLRSSWVCCENMAVSPYLRIEHGMIPPSIRFAC